MPTLSCRLARTVHAWDSIRDRCLRQGVETPLFRAVSAGRQMSVAASWQTSSSATRAKTAHLLASWPRRSRPMGGPFGGDRHLLAGQRYQRVIEEELAPTRRINSEPLVTIERSTRVWTSAVHSPLAPVGCSCPIRPRSHTGRVPPQFARPAEEGSMRRHSSLRPTRRAEHDRATDLGRWPGRSSRATA